MVIEGRRLEIRYVWLYIVLSALVAISVTFPLFLLVRHITIVNQQSSQKNSLYQ